VNGSAAGGVEAEGLGPVVIAPTIANWQAI